MYFYKGGYHLNWALWIEGHVAWCAQDAMQHEVYSITYELFAPRMLNLKLRRLLDLTSSLWEVQVIEKQIKTPPWENNQTNSEYGTFYKITGLVSSKWHCWRDGETGILMHYYYNPRFISKAMYIPGLENPSIHPECYNTHSQIKFVFIRIYNKRNNHLRTDKADVI